METYKRCIGRMENGTRCNAIGTLRYISYASGGKERCLCEYHARQLARYTAENAAQVGTARKMNDIRRKQTISYELEVSVDNQNARGNFAEKGCIPSADRTVTTEYKTPIWISAQAAIGMTKTVQKALDMHDIEIGSNCGTHIHIGLIDVSNTDGLAQYMPYIRRFYHSLFINLSDYLSALPDGGAEIFGRPIGGHWANTINRHTMPENHTNFVNVQHNYSLEFRQPVFRNSEQFSRVIRLCRRWQEITVEWAINAFKTDIPAAERREMARNASQRMIAEYERAIREGMRYDVGK